MFRRKNDPSGKKSSKLYVEPAELARKLIKELEGTRSSQGGKAWVRDQYTVFLCREDFARLRSHLDQLVRKLESHMEKHVQNRGYATSGAITVELTMDPDLKPGYFGVLAEREEYDGADQRVGVRESTGRSIWDVPEDLDYDDDYKEDYPSASSSGGGAPAASGQVVPPMPPAQGVMPPPMPGTPPPAAPSYGRPFAAVQGDGPEGPPSLGESRPAQADQPVPPQIPPRPVEQPPAIPPVPPVAGEGRATPVAQAPERASSEPLVLKVNGQEKVFPQGKAVIGRSRDADVQIDSPDVSRRHAVIYLSEGSIAVKDLGSTNGTMVNGYPVDSTVVRPSDVIRIGNAHITAASK